MKRFAKSGHFLDVVQPEAQTLLILDFEANGQGPSMTLEQARAFITHVNDQTGRYPDSILATTSRTCSAPIPTLSSPIAGSGCRNMDPPLSCPPIGLPGPCGNTPMAPSVLSPIPSPAPACATATSSTATRLASAPSGAPPSPLPLQKTPSIPAPCVLCRGRLCLPRDSLYRSGETTPAKPGEAGSCTATSVSNTSLNRITLPRDPACLRMPTAASVILLCSATLLLPATKTPDSAPLKTRLCRTRFPSPSIRIPSKTLLAKVSFPVTSPWFP